MQAFFRSQKGAVAIYTLFALWVTRPLIAGLHAGIPIGTTPFDQETLAFLTGDPQQLLFYNWLFWDNVTQGRPIFANPYEFGALVPEDTHTVGLWGFPLQLAFGLLQFLGLHAAYNILVIGSFPLTGWLTNAWLRTLGATPLAAFGGGLIFAFSVFRKTQMLSGHANGFLFFHLPLCLMLTAALVQKRSASAALGLGLCFGAMALGEWQLFYYSTLLTMAFFLFQMRNAEGSWCSAFRGWRLWLRQGALVALPWGAGVAWVLWIQSEGFSKHDTLSNPGLEGARKYLPIVGRMFSPTHQFERVVMFGSDVETRSGYLGLSVILLLLAVAGVAIYRRRQGDHGWREALGLAGWQTHQRFWAYVFGVSLVLIFSPVSPPLYDVLGAVLPYWEVSRVTGRMLCITSLAWATLAALVVTRVQVAWDTDRPRLRNGWLGAWTVLLVVDFVVLTPPVLVTGGPVADSPVLAELAQEQLAPGENILVLPVHPAKHAGGSQAERLITVLGQPMLNGYSPSAPPEATEVLAALMGLNAGMVGPEALDILDRYRVRFVLYDKHVTFSRPVPGGDPEGLPKLRGHPWFHVEREDAAYVLMSVRSGLTTGAPAIPGSQG